MSEKEKLPYVGALLLNVLADRGTSYVTTAAAALRWFYDEPEDLIYSNSEDIEDAFKILEEAGHVFGYHDPHAKSRYCVTDSGLANVNHEMNDENSLIHRIRKIGDSYIFEILANIEAPLGPISDDTADIDVTLEVPQSTIPAADRIVTKNDNQPEFDEAITAVEDVIAELEKDSSLDNILGDEKGPLISVLKAGRDLFETGRINVSVGIMYNLEPLKNFVERYKDQIVNATINGVITTAILALSTLFGIL